MTKINRALAAAYRKTIFRVRVGSGHVDMRIGVQSARIDALLARSAADGAAFITAYNPHSRPTAKSANKAANASLRRDIGSQGFQFLRGEGRDPLGEWPAEPSFLVLGIPFADAKALAKKHRQAAFVYVRRGKPPRLWFTTRI